MEGNVEAAITRLDEKIVALARRMDDLEKLTESVQKLAVAVESLSTRQSFTEKQLTTMSGKVTAIEEKPQKYWTTIVTGVISALVGAAITYFIKGGQ